MSALCLRRRGEPGSSRSADASAFARSASPASGGGLGGGITGDGRRGGSAGEAGFLGLRRGLRRLAAGSSVVSEREPRASRQATGAAAGRRRWVALPGGGSGRRRGSASRSLARSVPARAALWHRQPGIDPPPARSPHAEQDSGGLPRPSPERCAGRRPCAREAHGAARSTAWSSPITATDVTAPQGQKPSRGQFLASTDSYTSTVARASPPSRSPPPPFGGLPHPSRGPERHRAPTH